jgi:hypothetical protein
MIKKGTYDMNISDVVETFARMTYAERNEFCEELVKKWPHMAMTISNLIELYAMVKEQTDKEVA